MLAEILGSEFEKVFNSETDCFLLKRTSVPILGTTFLLREIGKSSLVCDRGLFGFRRYLALVDIMTVMTSTTNNSQQCFYYF